MNQSNHHQQTSRPDQHQTSQRTNQPTNHLMHRHPSSGHQLDTAWAARCNISAHAPCASPAEREPAPNHRTRFALYRQSNLRSPPPPPPRAAHLSARAIPRLAPIQKVPGISHTANPADRPSSQNFLRVRNPPPAKGMQALAGQNATRILLVLLERQPGACPRRGDNEQNQWPAQGPPVPPSGTAARVSGWRG